jgi:adenosylcobinamide kinase/adenosylcobinamide-phosphate guanylyltransferase
MITLLIGGVRAGKSARALALAESAPGDGDLLFVATAQAFDDEMRLRIDAHRRERGPHWTTLESPLDIVADLDRHVATTAQRYRALVLDCLTLWVSNILLSSPDDADAEALVADQARSLLEWLQRLSCDGTHVIVVSNEVGLGVVPPTPLGRRYRDALGRANQLVAMAADRATLLVAGLALDLKA